MDEATLAKMVAEAVAAHDSQTTVWDELTHNAEVLATVALAGMGAIIGGVKWVGRKTTQITGAFHELDKRVQSVEQYRESHEREDREAHDRLEASTQDVLREFREGRAESNKQHETLLNRIEETAKEGREGRKVLHEDVGALGKDVARLVGYHEARENQ